MESNNWASFIKRVEGTAIEALANNRAAGVAIISAKILVDARGNPILWTPPMAYRIEPSKDAIQILMQLFVPDES